MNETVPELLRQGLIITAIGALMVFAVLGVLWALMVLLARVFRDAPEKTETHAESKGTGERAAPTVAEISPADALTAERARVAAIVAGALMANAVPLLMEAPVGPAFEHGRTAPIWVSSNRTRVLQSWQPPRAVEAPPQTSGD